MVEKKYQYYIKERKNAVDVLPVMQFVRKKPFLWLRMKKALSTHRSMRVNVCVAISVLRCAQ